MKNGLRTRTTCLVLTLTTAGIACCSIGASDGTGWPATAAGNAAVVGRVKAALLCGVAWARLSSQALMPVAANPPKAAASERVSKVGSGRMERIPGCAVEEEWGV